MRRGMLVVAAALSAGRLAAQAPSLPVVNAGVPRGFTVGGMVGFANDAADGGTGLGVSGAYGFRRLGFGVFASQVTGANNVANFKSAGASVTAKILGGPLVPVSVNLQAGVGYSRQVLVDPTQERSTNWHVPVGLGISWTIPRPVVALRPWIAPRLDMNRFSNPDDPAAGATTETNFGLSGGITLGLINGIGIDLAFDRVFQKGATSKPTVFGAGLHYTFK